MFNFLHTCLVLSGHPLALTDCHVDLHYQLENFLLLLDQHQDGKGPLVHTVIESRGRVLDRVNTAS